MNSLQTQTGDYQDSVPNVRFNLLRRVGLMEELTKFLAKI